MEELIILPSFDSTQNWHHSQSNWSPSFGGVSLNHPLQLCPEQSGDQADLWRNLKRASGRPFARRRIAWLNWRISARGFELNRTHSPGLQPPYDDAGSS